MSRGKPGPFARYHSVTYWPSQAGIAARFRGQHTEAVQWFLNRTEFRKAARSQLRRGTATEITAEQDTTYSLLTYG